MESLFALLVVTSFGGPPVATERGLAGGPYDLERQPSLTKVA